jgi:hypothetical protein
MATVAQEYEAAYRAYEAMTKMNVPTPEGVGTFGGVWQCDEGRLLRALVLAIRRTRGACSAAAEKAARGEAFRLAEGGYGDVPGSGADVYRTPNGLLRDPDGRYLTEAEAALIRRTEESACGRRDYWTAGRITQRWIDEQAGDQVARTLTRSYLIGFPVCTDEQIAAAYRRVRDIYLVLASSFRDAGA